MARLCNNTIARQQAAETLGVSKSQPYRVRSEYLRAKAEKKLEPWRPGRSGGDHCAEFQPQAEKFLRQTRQEGYNFALSGCTHPDSGFFSD